ncbi:MAG TPA: glyoxalase [Cryomorphaceae bacterium]|nr:glyoxalase [Owenweeksia sp.]MBF97793.1 glyoxalase [Owenweeksia sp.]HAD96631.1 glyoxalase [Cryomorphaceae bacterium]HBF19778.1 glyoxalase [Cryomorphaceae bacterium]HCQ16526.1 glyoxalase [Cryomorphaceae bacterium]|tara:strand:+ start:187 stop:558 length:372 start_codon:yes stop_codon:yes gene_type:complete
MNHRANSIRPFIGARDFEVSRNFYRDLGFEEKVLSPQLSVFNSGKLAFYLQNAYVKDWVDNTMVFMEVKDVSRFWDELQELGLEEKYRDHNVRLVPPRTMDWGRECFVHDPSGILWHFGEFSL